MNPNVLKKTKNIDLYSKVTDYALKSCPETSAEKMMSFFRKMQQNREIISKISSVSIMNTDQIYQQRIVLTNYINQLMVLKSKITFGNDGRSCKILFSWYDTIEGNKWQSYNINFEFYNVLFNLAVIYFCIGYDLGIKSSNDKNKKKEAINKFKVSFYLFDVIKKEAYKKINQTELPYDLYPSHLDYCINLCKANGQKFIVEIADITCENSNNLQSKIILFISNSYSMAYQLSNVTPTSKGGTQEFRNFLINRVHYYKYLVYVKLREELKNKFDKVGTGFGEVVYLQGKAVTELFECVKNLDNCGKFVNKQLLLSILNNERLKGQELMGLNERVYKEKIPDNKIYSIDVKDMMNDPLIPSDLYIGVNKKKAFKMGNNELDGIMSSQIKDLVGKFRYKIGNYLNENIGKLESQKTINTFIQNLNLPSQLCNRKLIEPEFNNNMNSELPTPLWEKINKIQNLKCTTALKNNMQNIKNKQNENLNNLQNTLKYFSNEEDDDNKLRQKYGDKWVRKQSNLLNVNFINAINNYINNIQQTQKGDENLNQEILNNNFDVLNSPKEKLNKDIPIQKISEKNEVEEKPEIHSVKEEILKLYKLCDKCMQIINPLYDNLNNNNCLVNLFSDVIDKQKTEKEIYDKVFSDLQKKIDKLVLLSNEVRAQERVVSDVVKKAENEIADGIKNKNLSLKNREIYEYFKGLDIKSSLCLNLYEQLKKVEKYYSDLQIKIDKVLDESNKWMIERSKEKNALILAIQNEKGRYIGENNYGNGFPSS